MSDFEPRARQNGKTDATVTAIRQARERGEHVHVLTGEGHTACAGGDPDCLWWEMGKRALPPDYDLRQPHFVR